jgi:molybdate transport system ATP-binding protein
MCVRMENKTILDNISLDIDQGEQWVFFGRAGSGKTLMAHTLAGGHSFQGIIEFTERPGVPLEKNTVVVDQQHRFLDLRHQSHFYYQQRYNSSDADGTITVREDLSDYGENANGFLRKSDLLKTFHLDLLLDEPLIQLSNGENKRIQILKALLLFPYLLVLDEPFTGLDTEGRHLLDDILQKLSLRGQRMMLFTSRDQMPLGFNRQAWIKNGSLSFDNEKAEQLRSPSPVSIPKKDFPASISFEYPDFRYAVRMKDVHVLYEGKTILENINWEVERGSRWALTGHNGAGKSTLLSLITADNPQAYANEIYLFDRKRGTGESIWEIKQKTGFLSPELHIYFEGSSTAFAALASGLFDTIGLFRQLSEWQEQLVWDWLDFLDCRAYAGRLLSSLPAGIQRLLLLGRAMIKTAPLLVLDEPCQGLDSDQREFAKTLIDRYCSFYGATLIFVSHYPEDFPPSIGHTLHLQKGRMA